MIDPGIEVEKALLDILYIMDYMGDIEIMNQLIRLGLIRINDMMSTDFLLDSMGNIVIRIQNQIDSLTEKKLLEYLFKVLEKWKGNRKIITYSGVAVVLERLKPREIRKEGKEYWDYSQEELKEIINNLKLRHS